MAMRGYDWDFLDPAVPKFDKMPPGRGERLNVVAAVAQDAAIGHVWPKRRDGLGKTVFRRLSLFAFPFVLVPRTGTENKNEHSGYRWVIVAAGGLLGCVAIGGMFSLPVLLQPITRDTGWSVAGVSSAMTIGFLAMAFCSMIWGTLSDRFGPLPVVLAGSIVIAISLALASRATSLIEFQLLFGLLVGAATAAIFAPMMATVTGWFDTRQSLAVSLVSVGMGMAPMTMSPLVAWLVETHDWRTTHADRRRIVAAIMIPVSLLVRRPPALARRQCRRRQARRRPRCRCSEALRSPQFIILLATNFFCCATHSGPIIHTVSYAVSCGIPLIVAVSIYSVEGFAGLFGRIGFGLMGDRSAPSACW